MKTVRILFLAVITLTLALASGPAEAQLVLKIEDPALDGGEREVVDNGGGDINVLEGQITALISENGVNTIINTISSQDKTLPRLVLDLDGYQTPSDSVTLSLTDTDFEVDNETPGQAHVTGVQDVGNVSTFNYFGDEGNAPFEPGFTIATSNATAPEINFVQAVSVAPVGSLTLSAVVDKGSSFSEFLETTFTMILQVGQSPEIDCPPSILGETISKLGTVGDGCVIQDATIEDGNVHVKNVDSGFTISNTKVLNGDISIEDVSGTVSVDRNKVTNGDIQIEGTDTPLVTRNIVNGRITVRENDTPLVVDNVFSNGDMTVKENTGRAVVYRNLGVGTGSLEVDSNATAVVNDNNTNRDITCEDNENLMASGNQADRRLMCP
jgi:hypothetical protein